VNILRIVYDFPPPWWGLAPGTYELSKAQVRLGNKVTVLAGEWPSQKNYKEGNLEVKRLPRTLPYIGPYFTYFPSIFIRQIYERLKDQIDIIHSHVHHAFFYNWYRNFIKEKIPYVVHMNITSAERAYRHRNVSFISKHNWKLAIENERQACKLADAVICVSESVREEVLKWYRLDPEKVFYIPNGVNTDLFSPDGSNMRRELGLEDSKAILFVGRLYENKNVNLLIESLLHLTTDYKLLLIGDGKDKKKLMKMASELGINNRVIFTGLIPYKSLPAYYRTADVFVLPSTLEGSPKVVLEALSTGVPAVTSKCFVVGKLLNNGVLQLNTTSPESIAESVKTIVKKNTEINIEEIKNNYDWEAVAKRIQKVYDRIIN
jgi:glycosyltransferase involved in cell wall biosynthesis